MLHQVLEVELQLMMHYILEVALKLMMRIWNCYIKYLKQFYRAIVIPNVQQVILKQMLHQVLKAIYN